MKISYLFALIIILVVVTGVYVTQETPDNFDYKNSAYIIEGKTVTFADGFSEVSEIPGSEVKTTTRYFGNEIKKDLNNDGREDVAFIVTQDTGGSGFFYYVVAALHTTSGYVGSEGYFLGDRIAPQTTESGSGSTIIINYATRRPDEPMVAQPSIGKTVVLGLDQETMRLKEVK